MNERLLWKCEVDGSCFFASRSAQLVKLSSWTYVLIECDRECY